MAGGLSTLSSSEQPSGTHKTNKRVREMRQCLQVQLVSSFCESAHLLAKLHSAGLGGGEEYDWLTSAPVRWERVPASPHLQRGNFPRSLTSPARHPEWSQQSHPCRMKCKRREGVMFGHSCETSTGVGMTNHSEAGCSPESHTRVTRVNCHAESSEQ